VLLTLAFRHLVVRPGRALVLLLGYALGVGVMIVLLSVGEAMLDQSRDVSLVGGGEVTVLPEGIDIEAMRTGGLAGMFFSIDRARFLTRQLVGGPRWHGTVRAVSPVMERKLLYIQRGDRLVAVRAGAEIPSRAAAVGVALDLRAGQWRDTPADSAYIAPTPDQLYHELDHFHFNPTGDSTWAEWQYFNLEAGPGEWWYLTFLLGGQVPAGRWGGQLLVSHHTPDGRVARYRADVSPDRIAFDTARADVTVGQGSVRQTNGRYTIHISDLSGLSVTLDITPAPNRYFPAVLLREDALLSGYVVPALTATATGRLCVGARCRVVRGIPAYHDHNWGVWRDVSWDWGSGRGATFNILYGGVHVADTGGTPTRGSLFVALVDSLGVRQVYRTPRILYSGSRAVPGAPGLRAPAGFEFVALREADTIRVVTEVDEVQATRRAGGEGGTWFLQMRGRFRLRGRVAGAAAADSGTGFFETYVPG
jgi:hypothetical protein